MNKVSKQFPILLDSQGDWEKGESGQLLTLQLFKSLLMPVATSAIATSFPLCLNHLVFQNQPELGFTKKWSIYHEDTEYLTDLMVTRPHSQASERDLSSDLESVQLLHFLLGLPSVASSFGSLLQTHQIFLLLYPLVKYLQSSPSNCSKESGNYIMLTQVGGDPRVCVCVCTRTSGREEFERNRGDTLSGWLINGLGKITNLQKIKTIRGKNV